MVKEIRKKLGGTGEDLVRLRVAVRGAVQGVGFRPFIYRLATEQGLYGWVNNSSQGVFIEVEGSQAVLENFALRIEREKPPRSFIQSLETTVLDPVGFEGFEIRASDPGGPKTALILPDISTCHQCLSEVLDPDNRRYRYPFTNCTNCGPRFTIIESLPYDRPNTTMKRFPMCEACQAEYNDPRDRRFHAQPNACPVCGPHLELWDPAGRVLASFDKALREAARSLAAGQIVAVKGLGGFHLMVDARNNSTVQRLRTAKHREEKPLALMYPSIDAVRRDCEVSSLELRSLLSPESPIVLLRKAGTTTSIATGVAPGNPYLGVMLPYTPLHHLLMLETGFPVVATSGNVSDEPICINEHEALSRLGGIADLFLVHNRPVARHVDDSIVRIMAGREMVQRRARGFAPLPIRLSSGDAMVLAVGAHLKNTVALGVGPDAFISQHIGDLETSQAYDAFTSVISDFERVYESRPELIAADLHPEYVSTEFAATRGLPVVGVQHHVAHVLACMAENEIDTPVLGVSWDGTGYGVDHTVWGGEFLRIDDEGFTRVAHLRTFTLPGGESAVKEPRRSALGALYAAMGDRAFEQGDLAPLQAFTPTELAVVAKMLAHDVNSPRTSSAGRLFDAAAALAGVRQTTRYEGQAAMELEFALGSAGGSEAYPFELLEHAGKPLVVDWGPAVEALIADVRAGASRGEISLRFHNALVESVVAVAKWSGHEKVALTGGCFQNKYLTEHAVSRLRQEGLRPYWHQRVPPNDGGISLGQLVAARRWPETGGRLPGAEA